MNVLKGTHFYHKRSLINDEFCEQIFFGGEKNANEQQPHAEQNREKMSEHINPMWLLVYRWKFYEHWKDIGVETTRFHVHCRRIVRQIDFMMAEINHRIFHINR